MENIDIGESLQQIGIGISAIVDQKKPIEVDRGRTDCRQTQLTGVAEEDQIGDEKFRQDDGHASLVIFESTDGQPVEEIDAMSRGTHDRTNHERSDFVVEPPNRRA